MEDGGLPRSGTAEDAIEHERVEMDVNVERRAEPLDCGDGAALGVGDARADRGATQPGEHAPDEHVQHGGGQPGVKGQLIAQREGQRGGAITTEPLIRVADLTKHFPVTRGVLFSRPTGHVKAVDGISFTIGRDETVALVGESGCGKTTTARLLLRLERPTAGHVLLDGRDVHALDGGPLRDYRARVQAVFQDPWSSLNPRLRVRDTIAEALVVNRRVSPPQARRRVAEVLEQVGLPPEAAGRYPHEFSGGQRQRIALASALASDPELSSSTSRCPPLTCRSGRRS